MPRLLNLRALCTHCERAEATHWHPPTSSALCSKCRNKTTAPSSKDASVPIVSRSVIAALCGRCGLAPAALLSVQAGTPLCELCAEKKKRTDVVPLREGATGLVFDKMDFSSCCERGGVEEEVGTVDLSYYQTQVPVSVVGKRSAEGKPRR